MALSEAASIEKILPEAPEIPTIGERRTDELVLAVVGPVGSGCSLVSSILESILQADYGYTVTRHKVSEILHGLTSLVDAHPSIGAAAERVVGLQKLGNRLRQKFGSDYLAAKCIERIARWREQEATAVSGGGEPVPERRRHVHIIDSLKNPGEVRLLRETYGDLFWLFGIFAPLDVRRTRLRTQKQYGPEELERIITHDYTEAEPHGQGVRDTFFQADFFVRNDQPNDQRLRREIGRYLEVLFGIPVHTPTRDESAMYAAYSQAMSSACLSRQVGAAIVNGNGEIIGLGGNDVPKFGGGLYKAEDAEADHRCYRWGQKLCHNDANKRYLQDAIYEALRNDNLLQPAVPAAAVRDAIIRTELKDIIEYSRAVHAEMEAIISVARGEKAGLIGSTMFCTTYPCHACARHIVASGIQAVIYVEPYPKSRAFALHHDAVSESEAELGNKVVFLQYHGVAPKHALRLFRGERTRKRLGGELAVVDRRSVLPVVGSSLDDYATHERYVVARLANKEAHAKEKQPGLI